jgi:hypothetical protein
MEEHMLRFFIHVLRDEPWEYPTLGYPHDDRLRDLAEELRRVVRDLR